MSEQQTAFPLNCPPIEGQPGSDRASTPVAAVITKPVISSRALEALKWIFSFPAMLGTLLVGRVAYQLRGFAIDPDVWWHIKDGQTIAATHHWPSVDPYSFTVAGTPWLAYEWLFGGGVWLGWKLLF